MGSHLGQPRQPSFIKEERIDVDQDFHYRRHV